MNIGMDFNIERVVADLNALQRRQLPFAMQLAANRTMEERQELVRVHVDTELTIRGSARAKFRQAIRFAREDRADRKAEKVTATMRILGGDMAATAPLFRQIGGLILRQDQGGTRTSDTLYRNSSDRQLILGGFALPAPGLRTAAKGVERKLYPVALGLTQRRAIEGGYNFSSVYKGGKKKRGKGFKKNTRFYFVKPGVGIFVRTQVGDESEYDSVWFFRTRVNLPDRLHIAEVFQDGLPAHYGRNLDGFLQFAVRTAK